MKKKKKDFKKEILRRTSEEVTALARASVRRTVRSACTFNAFLLPRVAHDKFLHLACAFVFAGARL